jgi:hypothetical protein
LFEFFISNTKACFFAKKKHQGVFGSSQASCEEMNGPIGCMCSPGLVAHTILKVLSSQAREELPNRTFSWSHPCLTENPQRGTPQSQRQRWCEFAWNDVTLGDEFVHCLQKFATVFKCATLTAKSTPHFPSLRSSTLLNPPTC